MLPASFGAFWISLAFFTTLSAAKVFEPMPVGGDRLMLSLFGCLTCALWLCTFHTNVVTCWLFFSVVVLFFLLVGERGAACAARRAERKGRISLGWPCTTGLLLTPSPSPTTAPPPPQAGGVGPSSERVTLTKVAGYWGFMVAAVAFYDGERVAAAVDAEMCCCSSAAAARALNGLPPLSVLQLPPPIACTAEKRPMLSLPAPAPRHRRPAQGGVRPPGAARLAAQAREQDQPGRLWHKAVPHHGSGMTGGTERSYLQRASSP